MSGSAVPTRYLRKDPARNQVAPAAAEGGAAAADGSAPSAKVRSSDTTATPVRACSWPDLQRCVFQAAPAAAAASRAAANDVWDMMDPEEILSKLAKKESADKPTFYVGAVSEKWKGA